MAGASRVKDFAGVFSADTLPSKPHLLVVNTDDSHKPGRHWVCMWMKNGYREYFDSLGQPPTANFEWYLNRHCWSWTFNRRQLQSVISRFCGPYCICYCVFRSRGISRPMPKINGQAQPSIIIAEWMQRLNTITAHELCIITVKWLMYMQQLGLGLLGKL